MGYAASLSLTQTDYEYLFLVNSQAEWLTPFLGDRCSILGNKHPGRVLLEEKLRKYALVRTVGAYTKHVGQRSVKPPRVNTSTELAGVDLMHFTRQDAFLTSVPNVYQVYDLQHLHLPQFFKPATIRQRELQWPQFCNRAQRIVTMSEWTRRDVIERYQLEPSKVAVVPHASLLEMYRRPTPTAIDALRHQVPERFMLYPAQDWPHKNHQRFFEALSRLRRVDGERITVVLTGSRSITKGSLGAHLERLGIEDQILDLGFVLPSTLLALYELSESLIFPSLFEGFGLPVLEAMSCGLAVACSNCTALPELIGDAGLLFDPRDVNDIADKTALLWTDQHLRERLARQALERSQQYSPNRTGQALVDVYRSVLANDPTSLEGRGGQGRWESRGPKNTSPPPAR